KMNTFHFSFLFIFEQFPIGCELSETNEDVDLLSARGRITNPHSTAHLKDGRISPGQMKYLQLDVDMDEPPEDDIPSPDESSSLSFVTSTKDVSFNHHFCL